MLSPLHPGYTPKAELRQMLFVGLLCEAQNSIYINRGGTEKERDQIIETIMKR